MPILAQFWWICKWPRLGIFSRFYHWVRFSRIWTENEFLKTLWAVRDTLMPTCQCNPPNQCDWDHQKWIHYKINMYGHAMLSSHKYISSNYKKMNIGWPTVYIVVIVATAKSFCNSFITEFGERLQPCLTSCSSSTGTFHILCSASTTSFAALCCCDKRVNQFIRMCISRHFKKQWCSTLCQPIVSLTCIKLRSAGFS